MPIEFTYSRRFVNDILRLRKRFRRVDEDVETLKVEMRQGTLGDLMPGYGARLYKIRAANRSARRGKRGGFRVIYRHQHGDLIQFLHIYSKSDKDNVSAGFISRIVRDLE